MELLLVWRDSWSDSDQDSQDLHDASFTWQHTPHTARRCDNTPRTLPAGVTVTKIAKTSTTPRSRDNTPHTLPAGELKCQAAFTSTTQHQLVIVTAA